MKAVNAEYFLALVKHDQKLKAQAKLEALLTEGIEGQGQEVTGEYWHSLRSTILVQ